MDQESRYKMIKKYVKNFCKVRNPSNSMEDLVPDLWKSDSEMDVLIVEKKGTVIRSCFLTIFEEVSLGYVYDGAWALLVLWGIYLINRF